jgi:tRNA-dihydrouridine synthase
MLGRAIFGNPWLFHPEKDLSNVTIAERLRVMVEHTKLFEELLHFKNFATMKKHYKAYVNGFDGAAQLRAKLMEQNTAAEIEAVVHSFLVNAP